MTDDPWQPPYEGWKPPWVGGKPVKMKRSCPDCSAVPDGNGSISHDEGCPHAAALDALMDEDRMFFEMHPDLVQRRRPPSPVELAEHRIAGEFPDIPGELSGEVVVTLLGPGLRTRDFSGVYFITTGQWRGQFGAGGKAQ